MNDATSIVPDRPEPTDEPLEIGLDGWEPISVDDPERLKARLESSLHERLRLIDAIRGLQAEVATLRERYADGDLQDLAERYEQLQRRHEEFAEQVRIAGVLDGPGARAAAEQAIADLYASVTWRVGRAMLAPVRWVRRGR